MPFYLTPKLDDYNQVPRPLITNDRFGRKRTFVIIINVRL